MCSPRLYAVTYVINPWMRDNVGRSSQTRAMQQWQTLHDALTAIAEVHLIEPVAGSPDMVFTANAGLARDGVVAISRFRHAERQGEEPHYRRWFAEAGYRVFEVAESTAFEGEGDALFSSNGSRLWVGCGLRTAEESHHQLRSIWSAEVVGLRLIDPRFYHLDTCFAPLPDGSLLYYPDAFDAPSLARIHEYYGNEQRIAVSEADALQFACNAVCVGNTLVLNQIGAELDERLRQRGFHTMQLELDEFLKAGGAAKCLVMQLTPGLHSVPVAEANAGAALGTNTMQHLAGVTEPSRDYVTESAASRAA